MAVLDNDVPVGSKKITLDLLQLCLGHYCAVKYRVDDAGTSRIVIGLYNSMHIRQFPEGPECVRLLVHLALGEPCAIEALSIEYIYAMDIVEASAEPAEGKVPGI